jgi:hypothetical protein
LVINGNEETRFHVRAISATAEFEEDLSGLDGVERELGHRRTLCSMSTGKGGNRIRESAGRAKSTADSSVLKA